jgi:hypothetical protein
LAGQTHVNASTIRHNLLADPTHKRMTGQLKGYGSGVGIWDHDIHVHAASLCDEGVSPIAKLRQEREVGGRHEGQGRILGKGVGQVIRDECCDNAGAWIVEFQCSKRG